MSLFALVMRMARTPPILALTRFLFAKMTFALPVARLRETSTLLAFKYPSPAYAFHVLIVPKKAVASLAELDASDAAFLTDLFSSAEPRAGISTPRLSADRQRRGVSGFPAVAFSSHI